MHPGSPPLNLSFQPELPIFVRESIGSKRDRNRESRDQGSLSTSESDGARSHPSLALTRAKSRLNRSSRAANYLRLRLYQCVQCYGRMYFWEITFPGSASAAQPDMGTSLSIVAQTLVGPHISLAERYIEPHDFWTSRHPLYRLRLQDNTRLTPIRSPRSQRTRYHISTVTPAPPDYVRSFASSQFNALIPPLRS